MIKLLNKEEIEKNIKLFESVDLGDDIEFIKARKNLIQYIDQLEQENKALKKGITSLMASRKKWKYRYYKEKRKLEEK